MSTYRIGIVGTENSHADGFAKLINLPDENGNMRYPDCRITTVYGHYPEASRKLADTFGIEKIADSIEEMVENVDAVMITARDGKYHYEFAKPFIEAGIPAFVDKPFTVDPKQTAALISLAKEKNVPLCGGSMLKFTDGIKELKEYVQTTEETVSGGAVVAPVQMESEYSGFFFYSSHLTEMTLEVFGYDPLSVTAVKNKNGVCATINYKDYSVTNHFNDMSSCYGVSVFAKKEMIQKKVELTDAGRRECEDFINMIRTRKMSRSYEEFAIPVYYMNAVKEAYETGKKVDIIFEV